ncbi:MAG: hypothetical protein RR340_11105, partial [Cloacibacillus sp.]
MFKTVRKLEWAAILVILTIAMCVLAWAGTENGDIKLAAYYSKYAKETMTPSDLTVDLSIIVNGEKIITAQNGANTINLTGKIGTNLDTLAKTGFYIYGTSGDHSGDSSLAVNMDNTAQIFSTGLIQFYAGGKANTITGNSTLDFYSSPKATLYIAGDPASSQKSLILSGGTDAGTVKGNAKITLNGSLGYDETISPDEYGDRVQYVKITAAGKTNADNESVSVEGDSTVVYNADFSAGNYAGNVTGLYAGPLLHGTNSRGITKGKVEIIIDDPKAYIGQIWVAGGDIGASCDLQIGSTSLLFKQGILGNSIHGGAASWGNDSRTVISGDVKIELKKVSANHNPDSPTRIFGGGVVYGARASHLINGGVDIAVEGNSGINSLFAGGESRAKGAISNIGGNTTITIIGDSGINAFNKETYIGAGGVIMSRDLTGSSAIVKGNAAVTLQNISASTFTGTISGQGAEWNSSKPIITALNYKSVQGRSSLILDNVTGDFDGKIISFDKLLLSGDTSLSVGAASCDVNQFSSIEVAAPLASRVTKALTLRGYTGEPPSAPPIVPAGFYAEWEKNGTNLTLEVHPETITISNSTTIESLKLRATDKLIVKDGAKLVISGDLDAGG